jgi:HK97 family phage major capsid protein
MAEKLVEKRQEYEAKQQKLLKIYETAGDDYDFMKCEDLEGKTNKDRIAEVEKKSKELTSLKEELIALVKIENDKRNLKLGIQENMPALPGGKNENDPAVKSIGQLFVESKAYTERKAGAPESVIDVDTKTAFTTSAGWAPESVRSGQVVEYATRPIQIIDTIPGGAINQASYKYMEETTFTNNAAEVAEEGAYGEAALALTERSASVEKIGVTIPVTDEQLEDVVGIQSYLNNRLIFMIRQRLSYQVMNGNGSTPNLLGMLNKTGIQSFVHSGSLFDSIAQAIMYVRTIGMATASVIYVNSADWWSTKLRLKRDNNGNYILGNPDSPSGNMMWGVRVVENAVIPQGKILVGDTLGYTMLLEKRGISLKITDSHASEFVSGYQRIRADIREVMVVIRAAALCEITGV